MVDVLRSTLDQQWTLIHNFEWRDRYRGDIDLILVGPFGVWVMEVKSFAQPTRNFGDRWEYRGRWRWHTVKRNPAKQAKTGAVQLKEFLAANGIAISFVKPLVVWAGEDERLTVRDPAVPVWRLNEIEQRIEELNRGSAFAPDQVVQAVALLKQQVDRQKSKTKS